MLLTIGIPGKPAAYMSGDPFHRCTHTAMSPKGDIYVSDGYCNARVHKYAPDGRLLMSWGGPGPTPASSTSPHNITCDADGWVYVADRENHRVQVFDGNGKYETQWNNLHRPCGIFMPSGKCPICYIGELGPVQRVSRDSPNLGPRVTIVDNTGKRLSRLGGLCAGLGADQFLAPHGLCVDSRGDIYVGEVSWTQWPQLFPKDAMPENFGSCGNSAKWCSALPELFIFARFHALPDRADDVAAALRDVRHPPGRNPAAWTSRSIRPWLTRCCSIFTRAGSTKQRSNVTPACRTPFVLSTACRN